MTRRRWLLFIADRRFASLWVFPPVEVMTLILALLDAICTNISLVTLALSSTIWRGGGGALLPNIVINAAQKDGTVIGNISGQIILEQLFANPAVQYDLGKFHYLGVPIGETYLLLVTRKPGVTRFEDLVGAKSKQVVVGGIPGSTVEQGPILLRDLLGANLKVVSGYKGTADVRLAIESGEL